MFHKIALVIVTLALVGVLFGKTCHRNSISKKRNKTYPVFVVTDTSQYVSTDANVLLNGEDIGKLSDISSTDSTRVLALNIYGDVEIPKGAFVNYHKEMLGGAYIYFTYPESSTSVINIMPHDTVTMESVRYSGKVDTISAKVVIEAVHTIIREVDSSLRKNQVIRHHK